MPGGMSGKPSVVVRRVPDKGMYDNLYIVNGNVDYLNISGLLRLAGTNAAITIGATPPTSATAGTGLWIDRNGLALVVDSTSTPASQEQINFNANSTGASLLRLSTYKVSSTLQKAYIDCNGDTTAATIGQMHIRAYSAATDAASAYVELSATNGNGLGKLSVSATDTGLGRVTSSSDHYFALDARIGGGLYVGATNVDPVAGTIQLAEVSAPSAPAANNVIIYAVDNGSGKTQLMALFSSGAAQQLAIQP